MCLYCQTIYMSTSEVGPIKINLLPERGTFGLEPYVWSLFYPIRLSTENSNFKTSKVVVSTLIRTHTDM